MSASNGAGIELQSYKKKDVNDFVNGVINDYEGKLAAKDAEIGDLRTQLRDLGAKYESLSIDFDTIISEANSIAGEKAKIADVLLKAEDQARNIIDDARIKANEEISQYERLVDEERRKLHGMRDEVRRFADHAGDLVKSIQGNLNDTLDNGNHE